MKRPKTCCVDGTDHVHLHLEFLGGNVSKIGDSHYYSGAVVYVQCWSAAAKNVGEFVYIHMCVCGFARYLLQTVTMQVQSD